MKHESIEILLDSLERETKKRLSPSELARALNVSEQVVTNWAKRGISVEGALAVQFAFHRDANYILGRVAHPMMVPRTVYAVNPQLPGALAMESQSSYQHVLQSPFTRPTTLKQWAALDPESKDLIEALIARMASLH